MACRSPSPEAKPTRREALAYYRHVGAHHALAVRQYEEVTRVVRHNGPEVADKRGLEGEKGKNHDTFILHTRSRDGREHHLHTRAVVIATGGFGEPNRLDLPHRRAR